MEQGRGNVQSEKCVTGHIVYVTVNTGKIPVFIHQNADVYPFGGKDFQIMGHSIIAKGKHGDINGFPRLREFV